MKNQKITQDGTVYLGGIVAGTVQKTPNGKWWTATRAGARPGAAHVAGSWATRHEAVDALIRDRQAATGPEPEPEPGPGPVSELETSQPEPWQCPCYSCNGECGCDRPDKSYKLTHRGLMCGKCAEKADVTDDHLNGVSARVSQDRVRLTVDTWGYGKSAWLDVEDVDALMVALLNARFALAKERAENIAAEMRLAALRARADMATGS